ncbi:MAG TPA: chemotaxis protein CheB [Polyangiaceae bacterium]|nr:chemotaxis protein CheB [Polyangiaceae bacterium]
MKRKKNSRSVEHARAAERGARPSTPRETNRKRTLRERKGKERSRPKEKRGTNESASVGETSRATLDEGIEPARFPVVGIGASAGGLEALEAFLSAADPTSGATYLIVTHQAPGRQSLLAELLARHAKIPVEEAKDDQVIRPNHAYVAPPGHGLILRDEPRHVVHASPDRIHPVDQLFRSLAECEGEHAIGIVLSGTGTDGTLGVSAIKGASGMVMAQEPDTARYSGMPESAIQTQLVDYVLPPEKMPEQLGRYVRGRYRPAAAGEATHEEREAAALRRIFLLLRVRTGTDFVSYKKSTVRRRIERRMAIHDVVSFQDYVDLLERAPAECQALFRELLIGVTSFFRDPEAFIALEGELVRLIEGKPEGAPLRIWCAGCSTGEEAYSLAILVKEILARAQRRLGVQIFATDLDAQAVETARAGRYPEGIAADVTPERLERFFVKEDGSYRVTKEIRECLVFATQNVIKDPPFTKLDVVSCRNLLIYLEAELQHRALSLFGYSLRPGGVLLLGTSESVVGFEDRFSGLDKRWKVFRRKESSVTPLADFPAELPHSPAAVRTAALQRVLDVGSGLGRVAERVLLDSFAPASVLLGERGDVIYIHGRTGPFLEPSPGEPNNNVFQMAREGLRLELPAAVREAAKGKRVVRHGLRVKTNGDFSSVRLTVWKVTEPEVVRGTFVATFELESAADLRKGGPGKPTRVQASRLGALEKELQRTRENHQGTIEELETSNEELKSTNEELQSTNEELQSANEELETSREEMQSLNEELQTVNAEFEERNRALSQANDDMRNLLNSTDVATVFLDDRLAVKRFTTQAKKVFSLIDTDIGRPISDLTANLQYDGLLDDAREVLRSLVFREREIETRDGAWRLMRIMPYRTHDNLIDGLVITFVDIDRLKRAERTAHEARLLAESVIEAIDDALLVLDAKLHVVSANGPFLELFHTSSEAIVGRALGEICDGIWNVPSVTGALRDAKDAPRGTKRSVEVGLRSPRLGDVVVRVSARNLQAGPNHPLFMLLAIEDRSPAGEATEGGTSAE